MGLFSRKKKKEEEQDNSIYRWMTVEEALEYSQAGSSPSLESVKKLAEEIADQMKFLRTRQDQTKYEFEEVSKYLRDVKLIESMSESDRALVTDAARMIKGLDNERIGYQNGKSMVTREQYRNMEMYEKEIPRKLKELEKQEDYLGLIRDDMRNLEGEKGSITFEKESASEKRGFLVKLTYGVIFMILAVFIILIVLMDRTGKDFTIPFFLTGLAGAAYAFYFVHEHRRLGTLIKKNDHMLNRANVLLNKVKIKYVNTTNTLDYSYEKYGINSSTEMRHIWEKYTYEKEEEKRYRKNSQLLAGYEDNLEKLLKEFGFSKCDSWISQPDLLIDRGELADFKDAVATRRNKLKAQIDFNIRQQDTTMNEIEALKNKYEGFRDDINMIMKRNEIY
ncbi:MAG: hypothetical protein K6G45_10320 [Lachnospiraceae bacterium]|nr:hypothetical protein [Lachnospiraceae bacterium]